MASVLIQLLGGVRAHTRDGQPVEVGPPKSRAVLAALALAHGDAVPVSRLIDLVWDERPPRTAAKILQGYVSRLRTTLGAEAIVRVGAAYRLEPTAAEVDVARFRELASSGDIDGALAAWTGTPLAGLDAPALSSAADGLVEQWLRVVEDDLRHRTDIDPASTVGQLTELTCTYPFREGMWALLMTALARTGRQADALAAYQRARELLVEELGVEPGDELQRLHSSILARDEQVAAVPRADTTGTVPPTVTGPPTGTVTFGFVRIAESDRLWVEHRRKMAHAVARLDTAARDATHRRHGVLITPAGETIGAAFERARDAAAWANELQLIADREPWPGGVDIRLQIGLHTGEAEEHDGSFLGAPVHIATRLAAVANAGQILATAVTAAVLERHDLRDLGPHRLEGVATSHEIYQLDGRHHPPLRTALTPQGNLPRRPRLVGRDADITAVLTALGTTPSVTLVGPGGIGKTSLAVAVAQQWREDTGGRVWFVALDEIRTPGDVVHAVAESLGVRETRNDDLVASIAVAVASRPTLLVLDNCEHVIDGVADLAHAVGDTARGARLLATSREALGVAGEQLHPVEPLDPTGAGVELFAQRARALSPAFDAAGHRSTVEEICRQLDGLPLAIELAAARTRTLTPGQLRDRLGDRLRLLTGPRSAAHRHRTLRAAVQWSSDLLSHDQRRLFARLSVFVGRFDLAAAESVAADTELDPIEVDVLLGDLVERSMVTTESGPTGRRFRLLETLRQFAAEQLASDGGRHAVEQRHSDWCRDEVARIGDLLTGRGEVDGVACLDELWPNLRAAVERAVAAGDRQRAGALTEPIVTEINLRRRAEIGEWAEQILQRTPSDDEPAVVFWLSWALHRHMQAGNRPAFDRLLDQYGHAEHPLVRFGHGYLYENGPELLQASPHAVAWLRQQDQHPAADLVELSGVGSGLMATGRLRDLDDAAAAWAQRYRTHGPPTLLYFTLGMLGYSAQLQGDADAARQCFLDAAAVDVPAGTYTVTRPVEARAVFEQGDRRRAFAMLRAHIDEVLDVGTVDVARLVAVEFIRIMAALDRLGDAARALAYLDTTGDFGALARSTLVADAAQRIDADPDLARVTRDAVDAVDALRHMRRALHVRQPTSREG